ncbi:Light-mediated development protein DET1 [Zea mays]|uniref:Light-mediated development protein DET1 n=1 Tax=Zea mays TaxID=4577 RepID=A0A3L6DV90_MAIZE|nr:Light-mediated development protein DET1 [Zea mays]
MARCFSSSNLASRVFDRQLISPRPGATVNTIRQFYENLVPSYTIYDIDCPDYSFRKFTDDGKYLVAFSRNHQDLIVYRPIWLTYSCNEECDPHELPPKAKKFDSFFKQLYSIPLASSNEYICKDFFLYMECHRFGLFATSTAQSNESTATEGAIHGVPLIEKITFHLVRLEDGVILDEKAFCNDFINLAHSIGAYMYEDLLCIVSLRYQTIHILQIRDSGNLVEVRSIGAFCREDDELFLHSHVQTGYGGSFLPGIKQRLLSYIFCKTWNEVPDQTLRVQQLKKFYFHFQDYVDLIIWKPDDVKACLLLLYRSFSHKTFFSRGPYSMVVHQVQFLDRHHLFVKFGSVDGGVSRSTDQNLAFFAVYNMETTDIVSLHQNSSEELYALFEQFYDHFHANPQASSHGKFISSHSNDIHALDQLRVIKNKASSSSQVILVTKETKY